ncbi:MAG: phosphoribosylanthranilate isomerase [Lachnospiraceae bacterium]|nr:phosphoribosylanthranilate isomerase [Lachnospiraceae bacterium]
MAKVKICGLRTQTDVKIVNRYLPEYVGFVFANTRRFVTDEQAFAMRKTLDDRIQAVGVFVNEPMEHIVQLCDAGVINAVQLHGDETEAYIQKIKRETDICVIKAVRVQHADQVMECMSSEADFMLFDTYKEGMPGGTGERFSLEILQESFAELRERNLIIKPYFLAGGLNSGNAAQVICQTDCYAVDVSTGVETDGVKDEMKIKRFIDCVRKKF